MEVIRYLLTLLVIALIQLVRGKDKGIAYMDESELWSFAGEKSRLKSKT